MGNERVLQPVKITLEPAPEKYRYPTRMYVYSQDMADALYSKPNGAVKVEVCPGLDIGIFWDKPNGKRWQGYPNSNTFLYLMEKRQGYGGTFLGILAHDEPGFLRFRRRDKDHWVEDPSLSWSPNDYLHFPLEATPRGCFLGTLPLNLLEQQQARDLVVSLSFSSDPSIMGPETGTFFSLVFPEGRIDSRNVHYRVRIDQQYYYLQRFLTPISAMFIKSDYYMPELQRGRDYYGWMQIVSQPREIEREGRSRTEFTEVYIRPRYDTQNNLVIGIDNLAFGMHTGGLGGESFYSQFEIEIAADGKIKMSVTEEPKDFTLEQIVRFLERASYLPVQSTESPSELSDLAKKNTAKIQQELLTLTEQLRRGNILIISKPHL